ncbi:TonB dependent receptor [Flexibacter flexilis DSM 6793]|uniref:TonB dependent receptor n=1 Tax=Flexibacter flexilis DSM 6793 TaxID=927664 RepID=A0A1I1I815_9BACT|nr:TonB-dependent receptor [Flexibacter flexilis]SFC32165.1 TonB dependent receptor [Flexibacter flexilis DSM 6793]
MKRIFFCYLFILLNHLSSSAQLSQTVRGVVQDKASNAPIAFANVVLLNTTPLLGTTTDAEGNFLIANVPVGRYDLKASFLGYEETIVRELLVISAKQAIVNVGMKEAAQTLGDVIITPHINKGQALNSMATVSARMLSVEEAKRYAGGFDDPARLASAFAGVAGNTDINGIIVRGNAPKYLQWKMEGVEIPNPNHFGDLKTFGGGVLTGLSSQMLANSDFSTGAFPAEYNNALSGVFDISMRKGNNMHREHTFQVGVIGIDASSEGAFRRGCQSSYLFNYRNSTLALLAPLLPQDAGSIKYQDLSFKLHFPTQKAGVFSVWGIGLRDGATSKVRTDSTKWVYKEDKQQNDITQYTGAAGFNHKFFPNQNTYVSITLATTITDNLWNTQALNRERVLQPYSKISATNQNYIVSAFVNKKISPRHTNKTGILLTGMTYRMLLNKSLAAEQSPTEIVNTDGFSSVVSAYSSSAIDLTPSLTMNAGINAQQFTLNKHYTVEPRLGFKQKLNENQAVGIAYGLHSRLEKINYYFNNSLATGEKAVNKDLDFTKAHHFVLSYDYTISPLLHLRVEPYLQELYDVPVMADSSFSFINMQNDWFFAEKLQNTGKGRNYGIDFTLEKFISNGYYYLLTASVFAAKYKGGDGVWRDTRFNRNFVFNFLMGKEWKVGKNKQNLLSVNGRVGYQGGNRYSPINQLASEQMQDVVYDETKAFSQQSASVLNVYLTVNYKINKAKSSREISLKILNLTGQPDFYGYKYNLKESRIDKDASVTVVPSLSYKIEF